MSVTPSAAPTTTTDTDTSTVWEPGSSFVSATSGPTFAEQVAALRDGGAVSPDAARVLLGWERSYALAAARSADISADSADEFAERAFRTLLGFLTRHARTPLHFAPYHEALPEYAAFGKDFAYALVDAAASRVHGMDMLRRAVSYVHSGENVVFLGNHQSEADPYALDALLNRVVGLPASFVRGLVFMAGDRVRDDPVVAPFAAGRNLLTVYSKRHLDDVPELRSSKINHNRRTITATQRLLAKGGTAIWFAPSGGRDRRCRKSGKVECAPFDPDAVEMMRVTAKRAGTKTHFFPMALVTYDMLPPPSNVGGAALGEDRIVNHAQIAMALGKEIDFDEVHNTPNVDKVTRRKNAAMLVHDTVVSMYRDIGGYDTETV